MTRRACGCGWAFSLLLLVGSLAFGGTPRPTQVTATQRAVVAPQAFKADDPAMKSPQAAKTLSATTVSATFDKTPATKAFAELAKQSGYTIEPYDGGGTNQTRYGNVTATITNQPFWAAMREVCTRANVGLYYYGDVQDNKILLFPSNYGQQHMLKAPVSIQGPYLTVVMSLQRANTVSMAEPEKVDRKINLNLQMFAEPKARPTEYGYRPVIDEAVDDNGNSMVPTADAEHPQHMQPTRGIAWSAHVQLPYPSTNPGKRIARIRGRVDAKVPLQSEPWEIEHPLRAAEQTKTFGGKKFTFRSFRKVNDSQYTLEIARHRGEGEDRQTFQQAAFRAQPGLKLIDTANGRYQSYPSGGTADTEQVTQQFNFVRRSSGGGAARSSSSSESPEPEKLILEIPTATQDVAIPFELVDLPLP